MWERRLKSRWGGLPLPAYRRTVFSEETTDDIGEDIRLTILYFVQADVSKVST